MLSKEGWVCKTGVCVTAVWNMKRKESVGEMDEALLKG